MQIYRMTGCLRSCTRRAYNLKEKGYIRGGETSVKSRTSRNGKRVLDLRLNIPHGEVEVKGEVTKYETFMNLFYVNLKIMNINIKWMPFQYVIYDYSSFIADVGGYLGLLLGQSLYSSYLMMEERAMVWKKKP